MDFKKYRKQSIDIFHEALQAANPYKCVSEKLSLKNNRLEIDSKKYELESFKNIYVIAFGKASTEMALALEHSLGSFITDGIVVSNHDLAPEYKKLKYIRSSHPIPDEKSIKAGKKVVDLLEITTKNDLVIFLISGGGSSMVALPSEGLSLHEKRNVTGILLKSGVDTYGLNTIRKHISQIKGGGLLKKALPSQVVTLILSDVVGDKLDGIASGPTVPDETTFEECWKVIEALRLENRIPPQVILHLERGKLGEIPDTLKKQDFDHKKVQTVIVGNNLKSLVSAKRKAKELGYNALVLSSQMNGEAREIAKAVSSIALEIERYDLPIKKPACLIFGGETTVTVTGSGKGGRNTETALSFSMEIINHNVIGLFCGTDGIDGPTDAAGAICDGNTRIRARKMDVSAREHLTDNDSYHFFDYLGDLIITGSTGTNVMDLGIVLIP